ncbi:NAD(P)-binding domain-containing protein [Flectobacillus longus]|uniref:NAD(P)-binding domain-containing protein n=1 Tax=Flectobacillus longus TaxID=2984207 RepID=UPI0024B7BFCD|nr:NAD(P)-binding domain-containing protein [Flectobacillus longus]MDI9881948.1 NAD(P)-binding domain-containing protein [Flectobacillus longus]
MRFGIIDTGAIGGTIAPKMVAASHTVKINNSNDAERLKARAEELGAIPATSKEVVKDVDVIILSLPTNAAAIRDTAIVELSALPSYPSNEEIVEFNRRLFPKNPKSV